MMSISDMSSISQISSTQNTSSVSFSTYSADLSSKTEQLDKDQVQAIQAFLNDLMQSLRDLGVIGADNSQDIASSPEGRSNGSNVIEQAVQNFLHTLQDALKNGPQDPNTNGMDLSSGSQNGHQSLISDLQNLIDSLGSGSQDDTNISSALQLDFSQMVQALTGASESSPNLQDLLFSMLNNASGRAEQPSSIGSIISIQV